MKLTASCLYLALGAHAVPTLMDIISDDVTKFMKAVAKEFPDNKVFASMSVAIGQIENVAGKVLGYPSVKSDLDNGKCGEVMLIWARGTGEPENVGRLVGPPFLEELKKKLPGKDVTMQGLSKSEYPADIAEYLQNDGSPSGSIAMAKKVEQALEKCPKTKVIMGGWSQGAQVVHKAAELVDQAKDGKGVSLMKSVAAVVTFGDPMGKASERHKAIPGIDDSKVHEICHEKDQICRGTSMLLPTHFTYMKDTPNAAEDVAKDLR